MSVVHPYSARYEAGERGGVASTLPIRISVGRLPARRLSVGLNKSCEVSKSVQQNEGRSDYCIVQYDFKIKVSLSTQRGALLGRAENYICIIIRLVKEKCKI